MTRRMADIECRIHHETDKALLISLDGNKDNAIWIPKGLNGEEFVVDEGEKGYAVITMPEWFATEKGLV